MLAFLWSPTSKADPWNIETGGSFKSFFSVRQLRQSGLYPYDVVPANEERLRLQANLSKSFFRLEVANETFFFWEKENSSVFPVPEYNPTSFWKAQWSLLDEKGKRAFNRFDRAFAQFTWDTGQVLVGKQVISIGVGHIFNAVSQIQRYPLIFIDTEYPKTEDAVSLLWNGPTDLEARYLPKNTGQKEDNFHFRFKEDVSGFDCALTLGKSDDKWFGGLEAAGGVGESVIRAEIVGYRYQDGFRAQGLVGWDSVLSGQVSTKFEVFYNGFGQDTQLAQTGFPHRSTPFQGSWYAGNVSVWEIHPLLKANLISLVNLDDPSVLFHIFANYSLSNNMDLLLGRYLAVGNRSSEFGGKNQILPNLALGLPDITYLAWRWYF